MADYQIPLYIPGLGAIPSTDLGQEMQKRSMQELQALGGLPPAKTIPEELGRATRGAFTILRSPFDQAAAAFETGRRALAGGLGEFGTGLGVTKPPKPPGIPPTVPGAGVDTKRSTAPVHEETTTVPLPSPLVAYKDAQGRTVFGNAPGKAPLLDYAAEVGKLRPEGRQAGGVSSPVARDDQGRPTMVPDVDLQRSRQQEQEALAHQAIMARLKDEANPDAKIQRDIGAARQLAAALAPSPEALKARVDATFQAAMQAAQSEGRKVDPEALRKLIEQEVQNSLAKQQAEATQALLLMRSFPGQTLGGYGQMERYSNQP